MSKKICKHCLLLCKVGAKECDKFQSFNYNDAMKEYHLLLVSKADPKRLEELLERLTFLNGGGGFCRKYFTK